MENEKEEVYLEDALEEHIGKCIEWMNQCEPGSEQHIALGRLVDDLYSVRLKYTEIGMRYDDSVSQRQHEIELKKMELEEAKLEREAREAEALRAQFIDSGKQLLDGTIRNLVPSLVMAGLTSRIVAAEYNDNKFFSGSGFKMATSAIGKTFKVG